MILIKNEDIRDGKVIVNTSLLNVGRYVEFNLLYQCYGKSPLIYHDAEKLSAAVRLYEYILDNFEDIYESHYQNAIPYHNISQSTYEAKYDRLAFVVEKLYAQENSKKAGCKFNSNIADDDTEVRWHTFYVMKRALKARKLMETKLPH